VLEKVISSPASSPRATGIGHSSPDQNDRQQRDRRIPRARDPTHIAPAHPALRPRRDRPGYRHDPQVGKASGVSFFFLPAPWSHSVACGGVLGRSDRPG